MEGVNRTFRNVVAAEEEGSDQLGFETPRSGIATPQPDPHDKRLPGIMSYFNQVRPSSLSRIFSGTFKSNGQRPAVTQPAPEPAPEPDTPPTDESPEAASTSQPTPDTTKANPGADSSEDEAPLLLHEMEGLSPAASVPSTSSLHSYPTPPASQPSSLRGSKGDSRPGSPPVSRSGSPRKFSVSDRGRGTMRRHSFLAPLTTAVDASSASAHHLSNPASGPPTGPTSPSHSRVSSGAGIVSSGSSACLSHLKKLTLASGTKSGTSTPTRAFDPVEESRRHNGEPVDRTATHTPAPPGVQAPAAKGKLTIKIVEARGLKMCQNPYAVVVFQRSELISGAPRVVAENDDDAAITAVASGGIPIQRQASDSGRPAMAIPMRSRQSSNTSVTDYATFRNRNGGRRSFTNPKWDAEAIFDVVDSDMRVDVSVYGHTQAGEELLGHVNFEARASERAAPIRGWFALKKNVDAVAENEPTGEIYVEAIYQRAERRHFGPEDFQILRLIGKGTFGQVYQVRKKDTRRIYAMKVLSKKVIVQKKEVAHTVGERNILVRTAMADSPFIVGLKFSFQTPSDLYLVTDYMSGGELFWHLQKDGKFEEKRAKFYIAELILAIQHLHENDIVYRDLKPENILLDANGHIALCDFGLSKANLTKNDTTTTFCGTTEYLAPEVLLDESGYTKMVDFWSLGVLVFEMCCGWSPFYAEDTQQMYKNIAFGKVRFPRDTLSLEGRNFVKGLLNRNPKHRLGATNDAEELKNHAFFNDIDWDALAKKLITPPFKPQLKSDTDVSYFDPEFTNALNVNGSLNERAQQLARGFATSTPLSPSVQANFQGFTFVDESALEDHMRNQFENNNRRDDEMDEDHASDRGRDDEWDDLNDIDPRNANRMSGIVRTSTNDEQMFSNTGFDM
ncbi:serine/threonine-protein kinase sck1 [Schizothecium vesticola]|uniref:non-specific serine/threonine protein kinase n=1 Tax=Schizothecium vesticola TaxID=314040 RepID=A0AA40K524_9PEZI|nr:serine/threonine-protein kinase sck1 [Schizothecium vesticola]